MLWDTAGIRSTGGGIAIAVAVFACGSSVWATVEYDATSLFTTAQPAYDVTEGRPDMRLRRPTIGTINSVGQFVGKGDAGTGQLPEDTRPFFYDPIEMTAANLGDLTGDFADPGVSPRNGPSTGVDLNDAGWVVGVSSTATGTGGGDDRPFLWFDDDGNHAHTLGEMHELSLNPGATFGKAMRVNNAGHVLIDGDTGLYRTEVSLNAGTLSETVARSFITSGAALPDMNEAGDVSYISGNAGYVWRDMDNDDLADAGEVTQIPFMSVSSPNSMVFGINNVGQAVGTMRNDQSKDIGFVWSDLDGDNVVDWADSNGNGFFEADETSSEVVRFHGHAGGIDAGTGSTFAFDINDLGVVVGGYFDSADRWAYLYDDVHGMRLLDDLADETFPLNLREADAINNAGQITAVGRVPSTSIDHIVLLSPLLTVLDGDLDGDGFVGINDLNIVLGNWNQSVPPGNTSLGDPTNDGFVGIDDLNEVLGNWNAGVPPGSGAGAGANIPEPGSVLGWSVVGLVIWRRGRG